MLSLNIVKKSNEKSKTEAFDKKAQKVKENNVLILDMLRILALPLTYVDVQYILFLTDILLCCETFVAW